MRKGKSLLLAGVVGAGIVSSPVRAQVLQGADSSQPTRTTAQARPSQSDESEGAIADIVVTAQRRSERLQDVPITINAISGEAAASIGVTGTSSLQFSVPSLIVNRQANNASPFIRGIGVSISDPNSENSVSVYLDGVYQPAPFGNFFEFNNIERVEVLKGPQGTLFGRNATGGVIQVITRDPQQAFTADVTAGYAQFDQISASAYVSGGLADNLSANVSVIYNRQYDGWGRNLTTGADTFRSHNFGFRSKLRFTPGDSTTITLAGDYSSYVNGGLTAQSLPGSVAPTGTSYPGRYNTYANSEDGAGSKGGGVSLTTRHDFDEFSVQSISAYRKTTGFWRFDQDASAIPLVNADSHMSSRMFSQELHLSSPTHSKLTWLAGLYYFNYKAGFDPITLQGLAIDPAFTNPNASIDRYGNTLTRSFAVFGQATYPIVTNTNLTLGARYTWDKVRYNGAIYLGGTNIPLDPGGRLSTSAAEPTWRVSVDHKFAPDILGYLSYNRGFKGGNFSTSASPTGNKPYKPEKVDSYEVGLKTELFDRHVRFNVSTFYSDYKNIQLQRFVSGQSIVFNGPSAKIYGAEFEVQARPTERLTLNGNLGLVHTRIGNFPNAPSTIRLPAGLTVNDPNPFNAEGNDLPNAPAVTGNVGFQYAIPSSIGTFTLAGNAYYNGGRYAEVDNRLRDNRYVLVNGSIGWQDRSKTYGLRVWVKNLTDDYYFSQIVGQAGVGDIGAPAGPPRTVGFTADAHF
jgi:iron complex outermembrane recepter protein